MSEELIALEDAGWRALSTSGDAASEYYGDVLDDEVELLFPGGMRIDDRETVIQSMGGEPWSWYEMTDVRVLRPSRDVGIVAYRARSQRGDAPEYAALISSVYVRRDGGWRLTFHQQTPL